ERGADARAHVASAVERDWLARVFPGSVATVREVVFDEARGRAVARTQTRYRDLVLDESIRTAVDPDEARAALAGAGEADPLRILGARPDAEALVARLRFLESAMPELGLPADPTTLVRDALGALASAHDSVDALRRADVAAAVAGLLGHRQRQALEREAP